MYIDAIQWNHSGKSTLILTNYISTKLSQMAKQKMGGLKIGAIVGKMCSIVNAMKNNLW